MQPSSILLKPSMEVDEGNNDYRLRFGDQIKYLSVDPETFDEDIITFQS